MTFQPKSLTDVPDRTPDVQIFFDGQLLLRSDGVTCEVAVNPLATSHVLTIEARTKRPGTPDTVRMRHVGPLNFRQGEGMSIEVVNPSAAHPAAFKCVDLNHQIDYTSGAADPNNPPGSDFRWILNLEGSQFHEQVLDPQIFKSHHVIRLRGGEYFFRTAVRAGAQLGHKRLEGGKDPVTFRSIGVVASASVFFAEGQRNQAVLMRWQGLTEEGDHSVTLGREDNTTHEIYINNSPLFLRQPRNSAELAEHDELAEYYKVLPVPANPPGTRFKLIPVDLPIPDRGSPSIPCQVKRLDGTGD